MNERTVVAPLENACRPESEPYLRILRGDPRPEEIAALVAALYAISDAAAVGPGQFGAAVTGPASTDRSIWGDPAQLLRHPRHPRHRRYR